MFVIHIAVPDIGFCELERWAARSQWNSVCAFLPHIFSGCLPCDRPFVGHLTNSSGRGCHDLYVYSWSGRSVCETHMREPLQVRGALKGKRTVL